MDGIEMVDLEALEAEVMELEAERVALAAQIDALIRQATDRLHEQLAELRRNAETVHEQPQDLETVGD